MTERSSERIEGKDGAEKEKQVEAKKSDVSTQTNKRNRLERANTNKKKGRTTLGVKQEKDGRTHPQKRKRAKGDETS